jgi:putative heme iron utilization protein
MDSALTSQATAAICKHMNDDHADALAAYARTYGNITEVLAAEMIALDGHAMELKVDTGAGRIVTRIGFDHELADSDDARDTLIKMARHAMSGA